MPEHDDPSRRLGFMDEGARLPVRSTERESSHALMVAAPRESRLSPNNCVLTSAELLPILKSVDTQAEFLGPLLVEENLLVPEQLDLALKFAESTGLPLDQIVVAEFAVPQPDISRLLAQLNGDADMTEDAEVEPPVIVPPARPLGFRIRRPIGQIFVDLGFITTDDREAALEIQRESGALLGEILVEQGKLTRLELANALSEHWASFTTDDTPEHKPALTVVPPANGGTPSPDPDIPELRRSLDELEAARVADAHAAEVRIAAIDEALAALVDDEEFRQATTERLEELASKVEAAESGSTGAVDLVARLDGLASSTLELRSELDALASRPAEVEPSESANELKQTVDVLAKTLDDRLATLATEIEPRMPPAPARSPPNSELRPKSSQPQSPFHASTISTKFGARTPWPPRSPTKSSGRNSTS